MAKIKKPAMPQHGRNVDEWRAWAAWESTKTDAPVNLCVYEPTGDHGTVHGATENGIAIVGAIAMKVVETYRGGVVVHG